MARRRRYLRRVRGESLLVCGRLPRGITGAGSAALLPTRSGWPVVAGMSGYGRCRVAAWFLLVPRYPRSTFFWSRQSAFTVRNDWCSTRACATVRGVLHDSSLGIGARARAEPGNSDNFRCVHPRTGTPGGFAVSEALALFKCHVRQPGRHWWWSWPGSGVSRWCVGGIPPWLGVHGGGSSGGRE